MSQHTGGLLCPACRVDLVMSERHGVEIDYCPRCRGVWLDRGELDKILERATPAVTLAEPGRPEARMAPEPRREEYRETPRGDFRPHGGDHRSHGHDDDYYKKKKRRSLLDDIFDF